MRLWVQQGLGPYLMAMGTSQALGGRGLTHLNT